MKLQHIRERVSGHAQRGAQHLRHFGVLLFAYFFIFSVEITSAESFLGIPMPGFISKALEVAKYIAYVAGVILIVGYLLQGAGTLFDTSLENTVVNFTSLIQGSNGAEGLINILYQIWTTSRDIANILIIGIFVYIALSKIIGRAQDFKKLIVSLLSVAVLINFSFFFTQVLIDISNWSAVQVYSAMSPDTLQNSTETNTASLSETIIHNMGGVEMHIWSSAISTFTSTFTFQAFLALIPNLIVMTILSFITAILFFRMAFILIGRWIILVLLMATSSLAFAAMLIPPLKKYWQYWYRGLIYNAIVAPLLLLLLWAVTLLMSGVSATFKSSVSTNTDIISKLTVGVESFTNELIGFLITIGLLWAAIRIATALSNNAADSAGGLGKGINRFLGGIQGKALGAAFGGLGIAGRNTLGKGFAGMEAAARRRADDTNRNGLSRGFANLQSKMYGSIANSSFDPRNTKTMQAASKQAGVNVGKGITESFKQLADKKEKEETRLSAAFDKRIREEGMEENDVRAEINRERSEEAVRIGAQQKELRAQKEALETDLQAKNAALAQNTPDQDDITKEGKALKADMEVKLKEQEELEKEIIATEANAKVGDMKTQEDKISTIKDSLIEKKKEIAEVQDNMNKYKSNRAEAREKLRTEVTRMTADLTEMESQLKTSDQVAAERITQLQQEQETFDTNLEADALSLASRLSEVRKLQPKLGKETLEEELVSLQTKKTDLQKRMAAATDATSPVDKQRDVDTMLKIEKRQAELLKYRRTRAEKASGIVTTRRQTLAQRASNKQQKDVTDSILGMLSKQEGAVNSVVKSTAQAASATNAASTKGDISQSV